MLVSALPGVLPEVPVEPDLPLVSQLPVLDLLLLLEVPVWRTPGLSPLLPPLLKLPVDGVLLSLLELLPDAPFFPLSDESEDLLLLPDVSEDLLLLPDVPDDEEVPVLLPVFLADSLSLKMKMMKTPRRSRQTSRRCLWFLRTPHCLKLMRIQRQGYRTSHCCRWCARRTWWSRRCPGPRGPEAAGAHGGASCAVHGVAAISSACLTGPHMCPTMTLSRLTASRSRPSYCCRCRLPARRSLKSRPCFQMLQQDMPAIPKCEFMC